MIRALLLGVMASIAAAPSWANGPDAPESPPISPQQIVVQEVFPRLNGNGDGIVDRSEYEASLARSFAAWDRNSDGRMTGIEAPVFDLVMLGDRNGDGALAPREYADLMWWLFHALDADDDRIVSDAEWRTAAGGGFVAKDSDAEAGGGR